MSNIFERIKQDHDKARELISQIEDTTDRAAKKRQELFDKFKIDLWAHNKVEEATFYSRLESKGDEDESLEAKNEHHMVNSLLEELDTMPKANKEWGQKFHALAELLEHHMDEEEDEFFELARKDLTEEEAEDLGRRFDARKKVVMPALTPVD
ncbi:hemerythrin domain-containing protein [Hyphobacterium marinum]|uniref:Hemerythrin domain-containing protein n=1 Tax=Hyphobacterium marinum TaxID=3116574 RepID=A0ABU7M0E8_9PROT|nr:hemerythrin domain-containing protein [Hyphobacterium sp. Y6023]MEE2567017.1 hemerythrin domain-containing protein [Hyphobacterium sp. Y6023]